MKAILPVVRFRHDFNLYPVNELTPIGEDKSQWQSTGCDPQFFLIPKNSGFPSGWVLLKFTMKVEGNNKTAFLYIDYGEGFHEDNAVFIPASKKGTINHLLRLRKNIKALRWDPTQGPGVITLSNVVMCEIGWIERIGIMLRRVMPHIMGSDKKELRQLRLLSALFRNLEKIYYEISIRRAHQIPVGITMRDDLIFGIKPKRLPANQAVWNPIAVQNENLVNLFDFKQFIIRNPDLFDFKQFIIRNPDLKEKGMTYWEALEYALKQGVDENRPVSASDEETAAFYEELANQLSTDGHLEKAIRAYWTSLQFKPESFNCLQHLGDALLRNGSYIDAETAYECALQLNAGSFWTHFNLGRNYEMVGDLEKAIESYHKALMTDQGSHFAWKTLWNLVYIQWNRVQLRADASYKILNRSFGDEVYREAIGRMRKLLTVQPAPRYRKSQKPRVLMVVDPYLPQCVRYRVEQKLEQFDVAGIEASYIAWGDVTKEFNRFAFVDVVLFYRVPALPDVVRAMEYVKAIGKIVVYEIDDLVFDSEHYPDSLQSYGGMVSRDQYIGLLRGCVLFREAMRLSDYALASTIPLSERMASHVSTGLAFVHRNGLDSHNEPLLNTHKADASRNLISIFYGSGTKAHNSDFDDLVAPALARILDEFPNVQLHVVGHLTLPQELKQRAKQIYAVPLISDLNAYMNFLASADVNIAVLHSTSANDCKSELKWFEASVFGIPSVVSATRNYLDVVRDGEDALIARTPEEWYLQLRRLITDRELRVHLGQQAKIETAKRYSVAALGENLADVFSRIVTHYNNTAVSEAPGRKKIVIVNVFFPPQTIGGATRVVTDNVEALVERYKDQFDIEIFTSDHDNPEPYQIYQYSTMGARVTKVSTPLKEGMDWDYNDPRMQEIFSDYLDYVKPDLVHFHCIQRLTASIVTATQERRIPYIVTVHDAWWISDYQFLVDDEGNACDIHQNDPFIVAKQSKDVARTLKRQTYLRGCLSKAHYVLAVSETFGRIYEANGFRNVRVNRNGIKQRNWLPRIASTSGRVRLGHIGGMSKHKGFHLFKSALSRGDFRHLEALIVDLSKPYGHKQREVWGEAPVTIVGRYPQEKIEELYAGMDVLAAPSIWPESFGLVTREAVAAGVWVIASDIGALGEDIAADENGYVISVDDDKALFNILEKINGNPKRYLEPHTKRDVVSVYEQVAALADIYYMLTLKEREKAAIAMAEKDSDADHEEISASA